MCNISLVTICTYICIQNKAVPLVMLFAYRERTMFDDVSRVGSNNQLALV